MQPVTENCWKYSRVSRDQNSSAELQIAPLVIGLARWSTVEPSYGSVPLDSAPALNSEG